MALGSGAGLGIGTLAAGGAVVAVAGVIVYQVAFAPDPVAEPTAPIEIANVPEEPVQTATAEVVVETPEVIADNPVVEAPPEIAEVPQEQQMPTPLVAPSFDLVRVDAAGGAIIAGQAEPNAQLLLRLDGQEVHTASADGAGDFVAMLTIPASEVPQILSIEMLLDGQDPLRSDSSVIISPTLVPVETAEALAGVENEALPVADPQEDEPIELALLDDAPDTMATPSVPDQPAVPETPVTVSQEPATTVATEAVPDTVIETATVAENDAATVPEIDTDPVETGDVVYLASDESVVDEITPQDPTIELTDSDIVVDVQVEVPAVPSDEAQVASLVEDEEPSPVPSEPVLDQPLISDSGGTSEAEPTEELEVASTDLTDAPPSTDTLAPSANPLPVTDRPVASTSPTQRPDTELADASAESTNVEPVEEVSGAVGSNGDVPAAPQPEAVADLAAPEAPAPANPAPSNSAPSNSAPETEAQAPTVLLADSDGIRVLQSGPGPVPQVQEQIVLDTISYDTEGEVILAGRGPAESDVRFYLDNQPVQLAEIDQSGAWRTPLPQVDPGTYTLRLDEVAQSGEVQSRIETPFQREEPELVQSLPQSAEGQVVTVQWGNTLWGIAQEYLGEGVAYVQVYEANRDLIRNPDLIYPGQIFAIPDRDSDN